MRSLAVRSLKVFAAAGLLSVCAAAARAQGEQRDVYRLFLPGHQRALDIDLRPLDVYYGNLSGEPAAGPNKWNRARLVNVAIMPDKAKRKWPVSFAVRVEEVRADASSESLREAAVESLRKHDSVFKDSIKLETYKETALLHYRIKWPAVRDFHFPTFGTLSPIFPGQTIGVYAPPAAEYPMLEAYQAQAGVWVWIRREWPGSKDKEGDVKLLHTLLDSARLVDTSRPSTSADFYHLGRALYEQKEHEQAVAALTRSLELERERRQLGQPTWRQLIMTLANAYGATDDPARAREVLEYAAVVEPTYPYFHHGLARLYGFYGDMDKAVASLQKAYEHAPKVEGIYKLTGPYTDPLADVAFKKFKDDPRFRDAVKAMKKQQSKK